MIKIDTVDEYRDALERLSDLLYEDSKRALTLDEEHEVETLWVAVSDYETLRGSEPLPLRSSS